MSATQKSADLPAFEHHWQDEADAAFLYRLLATLEPDTSKADVYRRLADVEDRHVTIWADLITKTAARCAPSDPPAVPDCSPSSGAASARASCFRCC
jgi:hypothetical protein